MEAGRSAGERLVHFALNHFDRIHSQRAFQSLMQQEMIRLHRGEENALTPLVDKVFRPMMAAHARGVRGGQRIRRIDRGGRVADDVCGAGSQCLLLSFRAGDGDADAETIPWSGARWSTGARRRSSIWGRRFLPTGSTGRGWPRGCWRDADAHGRPRPNSSASQVQAPSTAQSARTNRQR